MAKKPAPITADVRYSDEQKGLCLSCLRSLHDLLPILDKAEACGIDCTRYREIVDQETHIFEAIRTNFMGGETP